MSLTVQRIRYPPFEHGHMDPSEVPIVEAVIDVEDGNVPEFIIGTDDGWFVEWRPYTDEFSNTPRIESDVGFETPSFIKRSRIGWYIDPDPLHNISRRLIAPTVVLLILSLFVHAIEPGLVEWGVISQSIAGSFRFGPLEYPKLLMFAFPIFLMPLIFRMIANLRDLSRQKTLMKLDYQRPDISIHANPGRVPISRGRDVVTLTIDRNHNDLLMTRSRIQVGVAVPERSTVLDVLGRREGRQPSPGMSTRLPQHRVATGDYEGTGVGEATPMVVPNRRAAVLEPMRVMASGEWVNHDADSRRISLPVPDANWPGTIYSSLIAIHWELVVEFISTHGSIFKWVEPVTIPHHSSSTSISTAPTRSGRAEMSNY
ncbi:MAG: hypothetical protein QGH38_01325 [Candidatus Thalassarchaeaceae archaeon]|jgi:hypothetical protein|nr:hypothetical protein [Candidatus Thalassarchaeaceae archaeon]